VKTITGHAQGVCESIDQAGWEEVVGTIAGENTIFVLCRSVDALAELRGRIEGMR
jgi:transcriptional regulator of arginine metabolism